jgi:hypothetical protein
MVEDLHSAVWTAYCGAMSGDAGWDAAASFQAAVDVLLARHPEIAAEPACRLTTRMIMLAQRRLPGYRVTNPARPRSRVSMLPLTVRKAPR